MFYLGKTSLRRLKDVHPDLVKVVERAIEITPIDFGVTEGLRTIAMQKRYMTNGKTTTMKSKHLDQGDSYSHAVDLYCRDNYGNITWKHEWFRLVIQAMFTAAIEQQVYIKAGGLWRTFLDSPHFELSKRP